MVKELKNFQSPIRACIVVSRLLLHDEAVALHVVDAEHGGKVLAVHNILHLRGHESPRLLVDDLILEIDKKKGGDNQRKVYFWGVSARNLASGASLLRR